MRGQESRSQIHIRACLFVRHERDVLEVAQLALGHERVLQRPVLRGEHGLVVLLQRCGPGLKRGLALLPGDCAGVVERGRLLLLRKLACLRK